MKGLGTVTGLQSSLLQSQALDPCSRRSDCAVRRSFATFAASPPAYLGTYVPRRLIPSKTAPRAGHSRQKLAMPAQRVRLLSWNIDMDTPPIATRARSLLRQIRQLKPDVILLQEVTPETLPILTTSLRPRPMESDPQPSQAESHFPTPPQTPGPSFDAHIDSTWSEQLPYFPLLLTRTGLFTTVETAASRFPGSRMYRGYICAEGELSATGLRAAFFTSHLESLKEGAAQRKDQLARLFELQRALVARGVATVFAGDTNLREAEVPAREVYKTVAMEKARQEATDTDAPPSKKRRRVARNTVTDKFVDAWLAAGADPAEKYTWDMRANNNLDFGGDFKPFARYDRVFMLHPKSVDVEVAGWKLVGKERLSCGKFVSDHWGVCVDLEFTGKEEN